MKVLFDRLRNALCSLGLFATIPASAEQVIFSEIHYNAKAGMPDFIELTNNTSAPFDMAGWFFSDGIIYTFPDFDAGNPSAHILKHFETILISPVDEATLRAAYPNIPEETRIFGPYAGALSNSGETLTLNDEHGVVVTTLEYNDGGKWPAAADGTGHSLIRINPNLTNGGWRNWAASPFPGGTPGVTPQNAEGPPTSTTPVAELNDIWKYDQNQSNNDLGLAWREPGYDDSSWQQGPGLFGVDGVDPFNTQWTTGGRTTYYLRRTFQFDDNFDNATIKIEAHIDDGAVFYLNGQEVGRFNMPNGLINFDTVASGGREWDELVEVTLDTDISDVLVTGTNVLAVEVHNANPNSNDIGFGTAMSITYTSPAVPPLPELVISEIHFSEAGNVDWVELHAPGNSDITVDDLGLATTRSLTNTEAISGTVPAGGYQSFPVDLAIDENGDVDLFLVRGDAVIDAARLDRDNNESGFESFPVGEEWYGVSEDTQDAPNDPATRQTGIVINEIMYDAPSDHVSAEFIELYNRSNETVDLSGWRFSDGVRFEFPVGTTMAPGAYLVVAADAAHISEIYGGITVLGDWSGSLRDRGELLRLEDQFGQLVDEVDYLPEGDWPNLADGDGSSMELRHPDMDNNVASAWVDSDESGKSTMQTFTYTDNFVRSQFLPLTSGQELHAHLVGDAHVVLENVSVRLNNTGDNLLRNAGIMSPTSSSASGWVCQGTHHLSFFDGAQLNLISTGHGDNKANRAEVDFLTSPVVGNSYTLSFDARWVYGKPRIILQTLDHGFGTSFLIPIPDNLGTPGSPNSAATATPPPSVSGVIHQPAVPRSSQGVTVTAKVDSAAPGLEVDLVYRLDGAGGNGTWLRAPMTMGNNGLFQATVNNFSTQGNVVQFYVEATAGGVTTTQPKFGAARPAMWIVDDRTMPGVLARHRFVVSEFDLRKANTSLGNGPTYDYNFPRMSNQYFNATFIANESEIYYNAELRKSGSQFTRSNTTIDQGKWKLPGDRLFRGRGRNVLDRSGNGEGTFPTPRYYDDRVGRFLLNKLGHPINEMEFVHTAINTQSFRRHESQEPISNDFLRRHFPEGTKGTLLRLDDHWRFSDSGTSTGSRDADWSYKDTENPTAYHSPLMMRTREAEHDYSTFIEFTRLLDENRVDQEVLERVANTKMLAMNAAVRGYNGDWDSITLNRGKNSFLFRPKDDSGWMLFHWDGDRIMDNVSRPFLGNLPGVGRYYAQPFVRRQFNYFLTKLLDEHTRNSGRTLAWLDAEVDAVAGSGVSMNRSLYVNWFNIRENSARNFVTSAVNNTLFAVTTPSTPTSEDVITLAGTAPPTIYTLRLQNQADASVTWIDRTRWEISGVFLSEGSNAITVEGLDHEGNVVNQVTYNVTKNNNAPPVIAMSSFPDDPSIPIDEDLVIDATASFDPEGTALTFQWSVLPAEGATLTPTASVLLATFSKPGFYLVTVDVTDSNNVTSSRSLGVSVHGGNQFFDFDSLQLSNDWQERKIERQLNASAGAHYSLEEIEGRLVLSIPYGQRSIALPEPVLPPAENYIDFGSVWRYEDSGADLTTTFADPDFNDAAWRTGAGFLGFNQTGLPGPGMQTGSLRPGRVAYFFRHEFEFDKDPIGAQISIDQIVDDGVRYYLNGQIVDSIRLPDGPIDATTTAESLPSSEENIIEEDIITLDGSAYLVEGTNVLAVQVHNSNPANNDLVFGARVDIAANPLQDGPPDLNNADHPWLSRPLPGGNWIFETEIRHETSQFVPSYAGLLVAATQSGNAFRYGVGIVNGDQVAAFRVNPSGSVEVLSGEPMPGSRGAIVRLVREGNSLRFESRVNGIYQLIHQQTLPAGTTFSEGGLVASTESDQGLEVSFGYASLITSGSDFTNWMTANGFTDPGANYLDTGMSNLLAYALGRDLNPTVAPVITFSNGSIGFSHRQRILGGQISYQVERSTNLVDWEAAGDLAPIGAPIENADGTFTVNLLSDLPPETAGKTYYRLSVRAF